ncbi:signal peptide peptidase SppA [Alkalicaulis satelles]|uniref:Signal peptide peptidase SppA n=1 Tax=Alkalicaulis satelles TaxID=2609175 RepID=A0A5M6ZG01_9PROT|nr:signal peptide peptidase SppA [Alkalicaulis satelles]KAA5803682.1 signal peptide peptidase SppA [Alkalicaulis satelles]
MSDKAKENIFARIWRWIGHIQHGILRVFGLILMLIVLIALIGSIFSGDDEFEMAESGLLSFSPNGVIVEEKSQVSPGDAFTAALLGGGARNEILLRDVIEGLRLAAADDEVTALMVNFDNLLGATPAALHAIAAEMAAFRETGKDIIAYGDSFTMGGYLLASQASEIHMHDMGWVMVNGYAVYRTFFRSLLDRLNVTVNIYRVGEFKSALEPFMGDEMSEEAAEANRFVFGELWDAYQRRVEGARGLDQGALQVYADTFPDQITALAHESARATGEIALRAGLIDHLTGRGAFRNAMEERFGRDADQNRVRSSNFLEYVEARRPKPRERGDVIALITMTGTIVDGNQDGGVIGGDMHANLVRKARLDDDVKAIVVRIDSGGGSAFASELIREELRQARLDGKIVVVSMGGVAASGGYWIAAPAHEIWAEPTTITGSIGIFGFLPTLENALGEIGVSEDGVALTQTARFPSPTGGVSEAWNTILQANIETGYDNFLDVVGEGRNMTRAEVDAIGQGRIWTGAQAHERGLVDHLGGFDEAVTAAAERAGLEEGQFRLRRFVEERDPFKEFLKMIGLSFVAEVMAGSGLMPGGLLGQAASETGAELQRINMMNDPRGVYATCLECESFRRVR